MIKTVTITGADDSISPETIISISNRFPFVEWGILVSRTSAGTRRFPSLRWIDKLAELNNDRILNSTPSLNLSCHLCGKYVRELLIGNTDFIEEELDDIWNIFSRVQINTHGEIHQIDEDNLLYNITNHSDKEFIFQIDNINSDRLLNLADISTYKFKYSGLFDLSHGSGILPEKWPELITGVKCGYAGGIGPDNIKDQIELINSKVGKIDTWIDMETKVRSSNDMVFDTDKVEKCLQIASEYIK